MKIKLGQKYFKSEIRMKKNKNYYLQSHRLSDVIALIQVLALDEHAHRSPDGLKSELQGNPKSGGTWDIIAKEHPEFFRFNEPKHKEEGSQAHTISLIARHVLEKDSQGYRELPLEITKKIMETAIELHDKEQERSGRWKVWLPLLVAIITVLSSFYLQYTNSRNETFLKHYEVELKPKQEGYSHFMTSLSKSFFSAQEGNASELIQSLDHGENNFYIIEPFLSSGQRDSIWQQYQKFTEFCLSIDKPDSLGEKIDKTSFTFLGYKNYFRKTLNELLFIK
jgi:hypothetical protein